MRSAPRAQRTHGDLTRRRLPGAAGSCVRSLVTYSQTAWEETPLLRKLPIASVRYLVAHCGRTASGGEGTSEGARFRKHAARQPYSALHVLQIRGTSVQMYVPGNRHFYEYARGALPLRTRLAPGGSARVLRRA